MKNTEHLTPIAQANKLVAWHTSLDIAARQLEGETAESLYVNGKKITAPDGVSLANWPAQFVVTACRMDVATATAWVFAKCAEIPKRADKPSLKADKVYSFQCDPGHGWMSVPLKTLFETGIADKVSSCSYIRGGSAYLEEDCDASLFINRMKELGIEVKVKFSHSDRKSPIRSYEVYKPAYAARVILEKANA